MVGSGPSDDQQTNKEENSDEEEDEFEENGEFGDGSVCDDDLDDEYWQSVDESSGNDELEEDEEDTNPKNIR